MYESQDKMVSHPNHYQSDNGLEVIDVIEAFTLGLYGIEAVDTANAIKYICRWKNKNGKQDLEKAMWYIQHLIDHIEKEDIIAQTVLANDGIPDVVLNSESAELVHEQLKNKNKIDYIPYYSRNGISQCHRKENNNE